MGRARGRAHRGGGVGGSGGARELLGDGGGKRAGRGVGGGGQRQVERREEASRVATREGEAVWWRSLVVDVAKWRIWAI